MGREETSREFPICRYRPLVPLLGEKNNDCWAKIESPEEQPALGSQQREAPPYEYYRLAITEPHQKTPQKPTFFEHEKGRTRDFKNGAGDTNKSRHDKAEHQRKKSCLEK